MAQAQGVYLATKKDGTLYYRASITYRKKHISLGSFSSETLAAAAYQTASDLLASPEIAIEHYTNYSTPLDFTKWVTLINYRDNKIYIKTPIYLKKNYFLYYLSQTDILKFDVDDLFYYSHHKIMKRGGHLFVADYGMQVNISSRYGIKNFAVCGRDYIFRNGDCRDYRYGNIEIINRYYGVHKKHHGLTYETRIHINGDYIVGRYKTEVEAAIAYNKAVLLLKEKNFKKEFPMNYIDNMSPIDYASIMNRVRISEKIRSFVNETNINKSKPEIDA